MTIRHLDQLFRPTSVAVIGASQDETKLGSLILQNLLDGDFAGPIMPVNPKYRSVQSVICYKTVADLPMAPDLAVIVTPPATIPGIIRELGERGTRAAIVITAGLSNHKDRDGLSIADQMLEAAGPHLLRILGPNCLGLIAPGIGLNASFAHANALPGKIAFASQSGALCTAVLDWANSKGIGFSQFISMGDALDVDFGDVIDYLANDAQTRAILLYIESITHARKFMSAARAAARQKPVIAVKAGRTELAAQAAYSHTGAMAGGDDVFSAALERAGIVRVDGIEDLFQAVETLARARRLPGEKLAIVTNGGGPGVLAVDALVMENAQLAQLSDATIKALNAVLPENWSRRNPVDVLGDANHERYVHAMEMVLQDPQVDAVLAMHAPTATVPAIEPARAVIEAAQNSDKAVLTCWMGRSAVRAAREAFAQAGLPSFETPTAAARAFSQMRQYRRTQEMLMETPPAAPEEFTPDQPRAQGIIKAALAKGRTTLSEPEAKDVLRAYGLAVVESHICATVQEAYEKARTFNGALALKIFSPGITHKSDVGGVALNLETPEAVREAAEGMLARVKRERPDAKIEGFILQEMIKRPHAVELIMGAATDPIFGPFILFGQGGTATEILHDNAIALPPLNIGLARRLIERTKIARLLKGYREQPPVAMGELEMALVKLAQMVADLPEIVEIDINPLFADPRGVLALDARVRIEKTSAKPGQQLAIRPYPQQLEEIIALHDGQKVLLRPIRPEDEPAHTDFVARLEPEDIRFRFFGMIRSLPKSEMARMTQIDYDREMAFIAQGLGTNGPRETLGVVRTVTDPNNARAEFAIIVRSDLKGRGLGVAMMDKIIRYSRERGTEEIVGQVMRDNQAMRHLVENLGFTTFNTEDPDVIEVRLRLKG